MGQLIKGDFPKIEKSPKELAREQILKENAKATEKLKCRAPSSPKFIVGECYTTRSICDHNCVFTMLVISRTDKTALVQFSPKQNPQRKRISIRDGGEQISMGIYSMAPLFRSLNHLDN